MDANVVFVFQKVLVSVPYFAILIILLLIGKFIFNKTTRYDVDNELVNNDNPAFGVLLASYFLGVAIALSGTTYSISMMHPVSDFINMSIYGVLSLILMRLSILINDKFILYKFSVHKEIVIDKNCGTSFVVGGCCAATGFVISGALAGESISPIRGIIDLCIYWLVGQILLVLGGVVFQKITSYDVHHIIGNDDNVAAGISFGGFLTSVGIITKAALSNAGSEIISETIITIMLAISGLVLLALVRMIVDKLMLSSSSLNKEIVVDKNAAVGVVTASVFVAVSIAYSFVISPLG